MSAMRINHLPRVLKTIFPVVAFFAVVIAALAAYGLSGDDTTVTELSTESGGLVQDSSGIGGQGGATVTPAAATTPGSNQDEDSFGNFGEDGFWYINGGSGLSTTLPSGPQGADTVPLTTGIIRGHISNFSDNCFADISSPCAEIFAYRADRLEVVEGTETGTLQNGIIVGIKGNAFSFDLLPVGNYKLLAQPRAVIYNNNIASTTTYKKTWYIAPGSPHSPSDDIVRERYSPSSGTWDSATVVTVIPGDVVDVNITMGIMTISAISAAEATTTFATPSTGATTTGTTTTGTGTTVTEATTVTVSAE